MLPRLRLAALACALMCPLATPAGSDSPLVINASIANAAEHGPLVEATLRFSVVNTGDHGMTAVTLRIVSPKPGTPDGDPIDVGNIDAGGTGVATAAVSFEKGFWTSADPLVADVTYTRQDGGGVTATLHVTREGGAK